MFKELFVIVIITSVVIGAPNENPKAPTNGGVAVPIPHQEKHVRPARDNAKPSGPVPQTLPTKPTRNARESEPDPELENARNQNEHKPIPQLLPAPLPTKGFRQRRNADDKTKDVPKSSTDAHHHDHDHH